MSEEDPRQLSLIHRRLVSSSAEIMGAPPEEITYQHTVLCQTCLPYRNPGELYGMGKGARACCSAR